ncbi:MAG TPA: polysaccharide deacetylase family protein [Gaiellaceae bacterium]|nr:polysaccharide deacetylase family protein [Gaiellaceae bacterium]
MYHRVGRLATSADSYADLTVRPFICRDQMEWLAHHGFHAITEHVITDRVGGHDPSFLSWPDLRDLEREGFAIGSHTVHHFDLTTLSRAKVGSELTRSREKLRRRLGAPIYWLSYPAGTENRAVVRLVRRAGYLLAFTTRPGFVQSAREPFLLHRDEIRRGVGVASFAALLDSGA